MKKCFLIVVLTTTLMGGTSWGARRALTFGVSGKSSGGRAAKTVITGQKMNLLKKGEAVEFSGGVTLVRGHDILKADRMISNEKTGKNIHWKAWAEKGIYDSNTSSGTLWGSKKPARVKRLSLSSKKNHSPYLFLEADKITFIKVELTTHTNAEAVGRVYVEYLEKEPAVRETRVWSNRAYFNGKEDTIRFWEGYLNPLDSPRKNRFRRKGGRSKPRAVQMEEKERRDITGLVLLYDLKQQKLVVENEVKVLIVSPDREATHGAER